MSIGLRWLMLILMLGVYCAIGIHTAAALYHHHVLRDNALTVMLPGKNIRFSIEIGVRQGSSPNGR